MAGDIAIDFECALVWLTCPHCRGNPGRFEGGFCEECGNGFEVCEYVGTWFANLAVAGALAAEFERGINFAQLVLKPRLYDVGTESNDGPR